MVKQRLNETYAGISLAILESRTQSQSPGLRSMSWPQPKMSQSSTKTLYSSRSMIISDMMLRFGASPLSVDKMWQTPKDGGSSATGQPNPLHKSLAQLSESFHKQQLRPGKKLDTLQDTFLGNVYRSISWKTMSDKVVISSTADRKTISLLQWTREVLLDGATRAFFGDALLELEPDLFETFYHFDDNSWKFTHKIPRLWSSDMYAAKEKAQNALRKVFCTAQRRETRRSLDNSHPWSGNERAWHRVVRHCRLSDDDFLGVSGLFAFNHIFWNDRV